MIKFMSVLHFLNDKHKQKCVQIEIKKVKYTFSAQICLIELGYHIGQRI